MQSAAWCLIPLDFVVKIFASISTKHQHINLIVEQILFEMKKFRLLKWAAYEFSV